jgi:hypothetical protein
MAFETVVVGVVIIIKVMGVIRSRVSFVEPLVALVAKVYPFQEVPAIRTLARACEDSNTTVVNLLPGEKDIRRPVWFMAIGARQNISGVIGIRFLALGHGRVVIAGISKAMLFHCPVDSLQITVQPSTPDGILCSAVAVSTKSNIVG